MRQYSKNLPSLDGDFVIGAQKIPPHQFVIGQFSIKNGLSLGGGFNPLENYWSNWVISPGGGPNKKSFSCHHL